MKGKSKKHYNFQEHLLLAACAGLRAGLQELVENGSEKGGKDRKGRSNVKNDIHTKEELDGRGRGRGEQKNLMKK